MLDWFHHYNLMKANPDKLQTLAIGKKSFDHKIVFELKGNRIECENDVKLLVVTWGGGGYVFFLKKYSDSQCC
jgi:hypothetical protein